MSTMQLTLVAAAMGYFVFKNLARPALQGRYGSLIEMPGDIKTPTRTSLDE